MLTEVKRHLRLIWMYFKFNLSSSMEYKTSFLIQVFGMILNNVSFIFFWWIVFTQTKGINGYKLEDIMYIWAISSASFGFAFILFGNIRGIANIIINGELDTYLLQPKNVYINVLCSKTIISAWGDLIYGIILFLIIDGLHPFKFLLFLLFIAFGGLLMGTVMATAETLTFFVGNSNAISRLIMEFLLNFTLYPESIFKGIVKFLMYSVIPAGFIVFLPIKVLNHFNLITLIGIILVDCVFIYLGYAIFNKGLKKYESGNLVTSKL